MLPELDFLREMNIWSVMLRLTLAMLFGGLIGIERAKKGRAAGFRTYMLVCLGAALTMLLGQYEAELIDLIWSETASATGLRTDVSRFGAQVINGIGFLGAGTIIVTGRQEVKGLTTAAGLWASACVGLAIGAAFYECVLLAFLLIFLSIRVLPHIEKHIVENARNLHLYIEFKDLSDVGEIVSRIKEQGAIIRDVDIDYDRKKETQNLSAVLSIRLPYRQGHTQILTALSKLNCIRVIDEV